LYPPIPYTSVDTTQPITGSLKVTVRNNGLNRNGYYGFAVDAGFTPRTEPRQLRLIMEGAVENNSLMDNGSNGCLFSFTYSAASAGIPGFSRHDFKYLQESTFRVADLDGELKGFDYLV